MYIYYEIYIHIYRCIYAHIYTSILNIITVNGCYFSRKEICIFGIVLLLTAQKPKSN